MKKRILVNLVILSLCAAGSAQSPLSVHFPLGMPVQAVSGPSAAMAGSGTAVIDEYLGATLNPANMAIGSRAAFSALVSYDRINVKDNKGSSSASGYSPKLLSLILPLGKNNNISFAMQKQYDGDLNFFTSEDISVDNSDAEITNTIELQNSGGLTSWQAGWGYRFKNRMSVGLVYERLFFNSEKYNRFENILAYPDGNTFRGGNSETVISSFSSNGVRFGMQIPVHEKVTAGVSAQYAFYAKSGTVTREYQRSDDNTPHEKSKEKFNVHLPPSVSAGLCYEPNNKWLFALDLQSTIWERYENKIEIPDGLRTTYGAAFGTSFTPATNRMSARYWETIRYRAGMRYSQLPIEETQEYMATLGTGLPIPNDGGMVDIIFGYGRRNSGKYSGYREYVTKFELGINGGRSWFQKTAARNY